MSKKLTLLLTSILPATMLLAQKDSLNSKQLDEVIVTANKFEQKQSSTGKVVTVINHEQIEKSSSKTVAQLLNEQVGISITGAYNSPGSVQTVNIRGAKYGRTLILIDGIPVGDPSDLDGTFDLNFLNLNAVERIEICKGAQSTLYGSDAVAGVINIITTKKEVSSLINASAALIGGNLGTYKANTHAFGKMGKFSYNADFSKTKTDGFSSAYDSSGKGKFDKDGYEGHQLNASLQYQPNEHWNITSFNRYSIFRSDLDASTFTDDTYAHAKNRYFITGATSHFVNDVVSLVSNYQYNKTERRYSGYNTKNNFNSLGHFAELYANIKLGNGFSLLQGADYRYGSMNSIYTSPTYNSQFQDTSVSQSSMYASLNFNSKSYNCELGGRLNVHTRYGSNYTYTFNPSYIINTHYRVFGSIASAFKAPSLFQIYDPYSGNSALLPEKSTNFELGLQQNHAIVSSRLVLFYREIKDGIDYNNITYKFYNFNNQVARGLEYEFTVRPTQKLSITGNYTYLTTQQTQQNLATLKDTTFNYSLRIPNHNLNLNIAYQFTPALFASISGKYVSKKYDLGGYDANYVALDNVTLKEYFLVGAYAEYNLYNHLKLHVDLQNITNKKFYDLRGYNSIPFVFSSGILLQL